jgi:hypothetical protein
LDTFPRRDTLRKESPSDAARGIPTDRHASREMGVLRPLRGEVQRWDAARRPVRYSS